MKTMIVKGLTALSLCCLFFIVLFLGSMSGLPALAAPSFFKSAQTNELGASSYLSSWEESDNKQAIMDFVEGPAQAIPVEDRIAVFDNDGTLWAERPEYFQLDYIAAKANGNLRNKLQAKERAQVTEGLLETLPTSSPMTVEDYRADVLSFLKTTTQRGNEETPGGYPSFGVSYMELTYQPMIELVKYLQDNGFSVFICSGGGMDFVRAFSEEAYGIPRQNVIGSVTINHYERDTREVIRSGGTPVSESSLTLGEPGYGDTDYTTGGYPTPPENLKPFVVNPFNDKEGKAIGLERYLGKKPIMAVGNSDGDFFMFDYTDSNTSPALKGEKPLIVLLNHDAECPTGDFNQNHNDCEYTYNSDVVASVVNHDLIEENNNPRQDFCADLTDCSLAKAKANDNWLVISMKDDFNRIFPWGDR